MKSMEGFNMHGQMWMRVSIFCNLLIDRIEFCPKPSKIRIRVRIILRYLSATAVTLLKVC